MECENDCPQTLWNEPQTSSFITNGGEIKWNSQLDFIIEPINSVLGGAWKSLIFFLSFTIAVFCSHERYAYCDWRDETGMLKCLSKGFQSLALKFGGIQAIECSAGFLKSTSVFYCHRSRNTTTELWLSGFRHSEGKIHLMAINLVAQKW